MTHRLLFLSLWAGLLFAQEETVVHRRPVPNRLLKQGEAQVIEVANGARFLRLDFDTKHLRRIEKAIRNAEQTNWPESADSTAYLEALNRMCETALQHADGPVSLVLEWRDEEVRLVQDDQEERLPLASEYLRENRLLILMDRFGVSKEEAKELLTTP
jgi:hypothetical protein